MFTIFKKEFKRLLFSPSFYLILLAMYLLNLAYMPQDISVFRETFRLSVGVFIAGAGAGLISGEFRNKTYKLLFSSPIRVSSIVFGKFLALFSFMYISAAVVFIIKMIMDLSFGVAVLLSEYIYGLIAMGFFIAFFSAVTIFFSSISSSIGLVCSILFSGYFLTMFGFGYLNMSGFRHKWYLQLYSLIFDYGRPFIKVAYQIISLDSIGYFLVVVSACLFLSIKYLEIKR